MHYLLTSYLHLRHVAVNNWLFNNLEDHILVDEPFYLSKQKQLFTARELLKPYYHNDDDDFGVNEASYL